MELSECRLTSARQESKFAGPGKPESAIKRGESISGCHDSRPATPDPVAAVHFFEISEFFLQPSEAFRNLFEEAMIRIYGLTSNQNQRQNPSPGRCVFTPALWTETL